MGVFLNRFSSSYVQHVLKVFNMNVTESQTGVGGIFFMSLFANPRLANILTQSSLPRAVSSIRSLGLPVIILLHVIL